MNHVRLAQIDMTRIIDPNTNTARFSPYLLNEPIEFRDLYNFVSIRPINLTSLIPTMNHMNDG